MHHGHRRRGSLSYTTYCPGQSLESCSLENLKRTHLSGMCDPLARASAEQSWGHCWKANMPNPWFQNLANRSTSRSLFTRMPNRNMFFRQKVRSHNRLWLPRRAKCRTPWMSKLKKMLAENLRCSRSKMVPKGNKENMKTIQICFFPIQICFFQTCDVSKIQLQWQILAGTWGTWVARPCLRKSNHCNSQTNETNRWCFLVTHASPLIARSHRNTLLFACVFVGETAFVHVASEPIASAVYAKYLKKQTPMYKYKPNHDKYISKKTLTTYNW